MTAGIHPGKTLSSPVLVTLWVFALALVLAVVPVQAQQSTQQKMAPSLDPVKLEERIERLEDMLKKLKAEQEKERIESKKFEAEQERRKRKLQELEERLDRGKRMLKELEERLDTGKNVLKEFDERLDRGKLKIEELEAEQERDRRKWETNFDLIRRDPRNRLEGTGADAGWISISGRKTDLRFGGFVQLNVLHDFTDAGFNFGKFKVNEIPVPTEDTTNTQFDPRTTRIIFETRTDTSVGQYSTFVAADWFGTETNSEPPIFRLRQAYLTGVGLLTGKAFIVGRATTTFMYNPAWPEMFDLGGPSSYIFLRQGLIRLSSEIDEAKHWIASFSIEQPNTEVTNGDGETNWPDAVLRVEGNHDWGNLMSAVLVRQLKATSTSGTGTDEAFAWGLNLSGKLAVPGTADNFKFQFQGGVGIGRYVDVLINEGGSDAVYNNTTEELEPLPEFGLFGGYQHWWMDKLRSTVGLSYVRLNNLSIQTSDSLKDVIWTLANLIYSPVKELDVGIEHHWGQRQNKDGQTGQSNRIMFSLKWHL